MTTSHQTPVASPGGLPGFVDVTPPHCHLYSNQAESDLCPQVVLVNASASPFQLLGLVEGRCREMALLAELAATSSAAEDELRQCAEHLWLGLESVLKTLDLMGRKIQGRTQ